MLDEWQEYPRIWNYIRREVDERQQKGQFILTGSATPDDKTKRHSGAGRFSVIKMRPMSLFERGWSTGEVSLTALLNGGLPSSESVPFDLRELAEKMTLGGWPGLIGASAADGLRFVIDYITLIAEVDLSKVSNKRRDPYKVMRLLQSVARNISTEATLAALAKDTGGSSHLDDETVSDYLDALERLMTVENLPAWNTHIRSSDMLRKSPKRHFADPSLAIGALGLSISKLTADLNCLGLLFESLVIRDLRIYAEANNSKVYHYRDSSGLEIDAIVEHADLNPLVVAINSFTAVVDDADSAVFEFQCDDSSIDVAEFADRFIDKNAAGCINFCDFSAGQVPGHVEIVDRHILEDPSRTINI